MSTIRCTSARASAPARLLGEDGAVVDRPLPSPPRPGLRHTFLRRQTSSHGDHGGAANSSPPTNRTPCGGSTQRSATSWPVRSSAPRSDRQTRSPPPVSPRLRWTTAVFNAVRPVLPAYDGPGRAARSARRHPRGEEPGARAAHTGTRLAPRHAREAGRRRGDRGAASRLTSDQMHRAGGQNSGRRAPAGASPAFIG